MTTYNDEFPDHDAVASNLWTPKPTGTAITTSKGVDHTQSFARSTMRDGEVVSTQAGGVSRSSYDQVVHEQNVAANVPWTRAVDHMGNHIAPDAVKDDTRITLPVYGEMTLGQAKAAGFIQARGQQRTEGGTNRPFEEPQAPAAKPEVHPDLRVDEFADKAVEQDVANLLENTSGLSQTEAIQQLVDGGAIDVRTLGTIATELGVEPEAVQTRVDAAMAEAEKQARSVLSDGGMPDDAILDWARTHRPNELQLAMHKHATKRQLDGYAALQKDWVESLADHNAEAALSADLGPGITQYMDRGKVIVRLPSGSTITWKNAFRAYGVKKS